MMIDTKAESGPVVDVTNKFRAPRDKVFKTWTEPELVAKWFMAGPGYLSPMVELNLSELGRWSILVRPGDDTIEPSLIQGHFMQVAPRRELTYSWHGNIPGGEYFTLVNVRFEDDGPGTLLRLTHGVFRSDADRKAHDEGWDLCMNAFAKTLGEEIESS